MKKQLLLSLAVLLFTVTTATAQSAVDTVTSAANQQKIADTASKAGSAASSAAVDTAIKKLDQNRDTFNSMAKDVSKNAT